MAIYGLGALGTLGAAANALIQGHDLAEQTLDINTASGIIGAIDGLNAPEANKAAARKRVMRKVQQGSGSVSRETLNLSDKALFEQRLYLLPPEVRTKLENGDLQLVPDRLYGIKCIKGVNHIDMFKAGDTTDVGATNVVQGKMKAEDYFLVTGIIVRTATAAGATLADGVVADFDAAAPIVNVLNGEWKFGQESTIYVDKCASSMFYEKGRTDIGAGYYKLETPKMLYPQRLLKLEFDIVGTVDTNTFLRVDLCGVKTTKA